MIDLQEFLSQLESKDYNLDKIEEAFIWAALLHEGQRRKFEDEPYFIHPVRIGLLLANHGEDMVIAALLHDVLEKTIGSQQEIESKFGTTVLHLVLGVSKIEGRSMSGAFDTVVDREPRAITLRVADRIDNLRYKFSQLPLERKGSYHLENLEILSYMRDYLCYDLLNLLLDEIKTVEAPPIMDQTSEARLRNLEFYKFFEQLKDKSNPELTKEAFEYGLEMHKNETREGSDMPYFVHPVGVALNLKNWDNEMVVAGLLHDVVEDTEATLEEVTQRFGQRAAQLVRGVTKRDGFATMKILEEVIGEYPEVMTLKLADRLDNLNDNIDKMKRETIEKYKLETPKLIQRAIELNHLDFTEDLQLILQNL